MKESRVRKFWKKDRIFGSTTNRIELWRTGVLFSDNTNEKDANN